VFTEKQLEQLAHAKDDTLRKSFDLVFRAISREYRTEKAREYATHGFGRRLRTLDHCLERVFKALTPHGAGLPDRNTVQDATAFLQSFLVNCYGAFDNLAHIWVAENNVRDTRGSPIGRNSIGLTPKYALVRESLPRTVRDKLGEYDEWFGYLEDYRHALAHRIPVYIADRAYRPADVDKLAALREQKTAAYQRRDYDEIERLANEEARIGVFNPLMMHSYGERATPIYFHSQMLCDHATIVEFASTFFDGLDA
jgi:hypothetical protein